MTWARNNKFLAGFFAFMAVAVIGLGYLLYTSWSAYSDTSDDYEKQATELVRLQTLVPYPDDANLKAYKAQRDVYARDSADLQASLTAWNRRLQPMTPPQFQEELKEAAADYVGKAVAGGLKLPQNFYLGFDAYRDSPPSDAAASPLDRQLKGVQIILNELLDSKVSSIVSVNRTPLVEESGAQPAAPAKGAKPGAGSPLVSYYPFEVQFTGGQNQFRRFLNSIVHSKDQFFVVRTLAITNSKTKGPPRETAEAGPPGTPKPDGLAGVSQEGEKNAIEFVLGKESISVVMRIDIVEFATPAPGA